MLRSYLVPINVLLLVQNGPVESSGLIDCPLYDPSQPRKGCPCKCVENEENFELKQVTVDKEFCTDLVIENFNFESVASDVSISLASGTNLPNRFEFILTNAKSITPLETVKIGGQTQSYTSLYFYFNRWLDETQVQPMLNLHSDNLEQFHIQGSNRPGALKVSKPLKKCLLFELIEIGGNIRFEFNSVVIPGQEADLSGSITRAAFVLDNVEVSIDSPFRVWFKDTKLPMM